MKKPKPNPTITANREFNQKLEAAREQILAKYTAKGKPIPNYPIPVCLSAFGIDPPPPKKLTNEEKLYFRVKRLEKLLKKKDEQIVALKNQLNKEK